MQYMAHSQDTQDPHYPIEYHTILLGLTDSIHKLQDTIEALNTVVASIRRDAADITLRMRDIEYQIYLHTHTLQQEISRYQFSTQ